MKMLLRELFYRTLNEAEAPEYADALKAIDTTDSLWKRSKRGSVKSDEVKALQQALNDLGYDVGAADGWFGKKTATAVRKFQSDNDLTVDGDPGANTISKMNSVVADKYPEEPETGGRGDGDAEADRRAADNNGQPRGTEDDVMSQQVVEPDNGWQDVDPQFAQGLPDGYEIKRGRVDGEDMFLLVRPNGTEETSNDLQGLIRVAQADIEADQERAAGQGIDGQDAQRAQGMGVERPADPASTMRDNEIEGTGRFRITPSPNNPTTFVIRRPDGTIDDAYGAFTRTRADGAAQDEVDRRNAALDRTEEPEVTGSGRGDGNAEVAARREEAAKQATEEFVRAQVAELTRVRATMPNDQLIRTITQRAVEQGLNDDWRENGAMAEYIAELVPTVDRTTPTPTASTDAPTMSQPGTGDDSGADQLTRQATDDERAFQAAQGITAPDADAAPSVDSTTAAAQQISRFQQAYGNGTDGQLPTQFRDAILNPALNYQQNTPAQETQSLNAMKKLQAEVAGEIPQAVARVTIERMLQSDFGREVRGVDTFPGLINELKGMVQELQGDPDLRTQAEYYQIKLAVIEKLMQDAARPNESVELDRIKMLAGV